jgi:hypothetical protein
MKQEDGPSGEKSQNQIISVSDKKHFHGEFSYDF